MVSSVCDAPPTLPRVPVNWDGCWFSVWPLAVFVVWVAICWVTLTYIACTIYLLGDHLFLDLQHICSIGCSHRIVIECNAKLTEELILARQIVWEFKTMWAIIVLWHFEAAWTWGLLLNNHLINDYSSKDSRSWGWDVADPKEQGHIIPLGSAQSQARQTQARDDWFLLKEGWWHLGRIWGLKKWWLANWYDWVSLCGQEYAIDEANWCVLKDCSIWVHYTDMHSRGIMHNYNRSCNIKEPKYNYLIYQELLRVPRTAKVVVNRSLLWLVHAIWF